MRLQALPWVACVRPLDATFHPAHSLDASECIRQGLLILGNGMGR